MFVYGCGNSNSSVDMQGSVFSESLDSKDAFGFIGDSLSSMPIQGELVQSGEYFDFAVELLCIWSDKDQKALGDLLTKSSIAMYKDAGKGAEIELWSKAISEMMLKADRNEPKIFATKIEDLSKDPAYTAQKQWFTYPEEPTSAIVLYSYDREKKQMQGRIFSLVKVDGAFQIVLEMPKTK